MHAVVGAIVTATTQLFEQALGRAAFPRGSFASSLQDLGRTSTHSPSFALVHARSYLNSLRATITLRTVARDTDSVRTISLIAAAARNRRDVSGRISPRLSSPQHPSSHRAKGKMLTQDVRRGLELDAKSPLKGHYACDLHL